MLLVYIVLILVIFKGLHDHQNKFEVGNTGMVFLVFHNCLTLVKIQCCDGLDSIPIQQLTDIPRSENAIP